MTDQATGGAAANSGGTPAPNGGMPLPATRENFMENMRAKDAAARERHQQARALGQRTNGAPQSSNPIGDRARAAEAQAKATPSGNQPQPTIQDEAAGGVSRETAPQTPPEGAEGQEPVETGTETGGEGVLDGDALFAKAKEWRDSPTLPKDFDDRLVEQKVIGLDGKKTTQMVTVAELKENGMRQYDYSRAGDMIRSKDADLGRRESRMNEHFESINDPKEFLQRHEDMGYSEVLDAALLEYAERKQRERSMIRAAGIAEMQRLGCDENDRRVWKVMEETEAEIADARKSKIENRRLSREQKSFEENRKQAELDARTQQSSASLKKSLDQLRPVAFKAYGVADNGANETDFYRHLKSVTDNDREWDGEVISIQHCMRAAEGLAQELGDRRGHNPKPANGKGQPLPPTRLGGSGTARAAAKAQQEERKRPSDFAAQYLKRGF